MAKDVCVALGYPIAPGVSNANNYTKKLADDERIVLTRGTTGVNHLPLFEGTRIPRIQIISESGLYTLCLRSDKADAKPFQDWVTREVLPSIRKTGSYALADHGREAMPLPVDIAEAVAKAIAPLEEKIESLTALIEGLTPKPEADRMLTASAALKPGK